MRNIFSAAMLSTLLVSSVIAPAAANDSASHSSKSLSRSIPQSLYGCYEVGVDSPPEYAIAKNKLRMLNVQGQELSEGKILSVTTNNANAFSGVVEWHVYNRDIVMKGKYGYAVYKRLLRKEKENIDIRKEDGKVIFNGTVAAQLQCHKDGGILKQKLGK